MVMNNHHLNKLKTMRDLFFILCIAFGILYLIGGSKMSNEMKPQLGKQVVLENDTLTIVDYNVDKCSYILSNGITIYWKYGNDLIIK